ncbi:MULTISPECIES: GNAT family N-acetyltransferase [Bacillaceae]|uniref:GNAT family N-acetyltransferase n=1 Tax=Evansella alkalicola TaxID=745819 RepID=A0ABS6JYU5_9BACI|nr:MULTISPECIES: GNAT family N-acetyltransferase [Bacillaceae]MBU9723397.1 GNAT family N-acetyltransferase [Bacillus alkalicola]
MRYTDKLDSVTKDKLTGFFVGWPNPPSPETHMKLLENSSHIVLAVEEESGQVVGFITAISDGVLSAYIPLLEVVPEFQGQGIGNELVKQMLQKLDGLYMVDLLCDEELQPYYEKQSMIKATGMMIRNYQNQSGKG